MQATGDDAAALVRRAGGSTVVGLFEGQARLHPDRIAAQEGSGEGARRLTYRALEERSRRLAGLMAARGLGPGDRVAILSENRLEYLEAFLAAGWLGAIAACQNWRLTPRELRHCLDLVEPALLLVSPRHEMKLAETGGQGADAIVLGDAYEAALAGSEPLDATGEVDPEDPLLILYTSGTTGLPKGAVISHRAEIARNLVIRAEYGLAPEDAFVAWPPLYHMGAADWSLGALMTGGKVIVVDGFDRTRLAEIVETEALGWLLLMPGMVGGLIAELEARGSKTRGVRLCGVMADLVPPAEIARVTTLLGAPYVNSFGATETGCPPCSSNLIPIGTAPQQLAKEQSPFCQIRLVDAADRDVPDGTPGEICVRGPTVFSSYWQAREANAEAFRGGWFHMGDVFVRNPDGTYDFVDRLKYLIKTGGENVYPAELERVILQDRRVADVAVVRRADPRWGEVPVAFVARREESLTEEDLYALCRAELPGYKQPKAILFIAFEDFPRSASGKIQRHELEKRLGREA